MRCIYCLSDKVESAFSTAEHVIPQAFGRFKNNLTLVNLVCDACNRYFGEVLDRPLARDSLEGTERFRQGLRSPRNYKGVGKASRIQRRVVGGLWDGALAYLAPAPDGGGLVPMPVPQIAFLRNGKFEHYAIDALPSKDELLKLGFDISATNCFRILGCEPEQAVAAAKERGISIRPGPSVEMERNRTETKVRVTATVDQTIRRGVAKVSFNYLAYWERAFVLQSCFDETRRFIGQAEEPDAYPLVHVTQESILADEPTMGRRRAGHLLTVNWTNDGRAIVGQVSLMNLFKYTVALAPRYDGPPRDITRGHFFNLKNMEILELCRRRRVAGPRVGE